MAASAVAAVAAGAAAIADKIDTNEHTTPMLFPASMGFFRAPRRFRAPEQKGACHRQTVARHGPRQCVAAPSTNRTRPRDVTDTLHCTPGRASRSGAFSSRPSAVYRRRPPRYPQSPLRAFSAARQRSVHEPSPCLAALPHAGPRTTRDTEAQHFLSKPCLRPGTGSSVSPEPAPVVPHPGQAVEGNPGRVKMEAMSDPGKLSCSYCAGIHATAR